VKRVLAFETSCDDTSVAIIEDPGRVLSCVTANQDLQHEVFGGVVPEIASRNHSLNLLPLVDVAFEKAGMTWSDMDGIAVTNRPGLVGSLLVGVMTAKTLSLAKGLPIIGVNHLEGHLWAPFLSDDSYSLQQGFPQEYIALAISGGHTQIYHVRGLGQYKVLGATLDDAAGEAFDKFAKMTGLGFPGGALVDQYARSGNPKSFHFPRALMTEDDLRFSFSGLKTAAQRQVESMTEQQLKDQIHDLSASYQEAICEVLVAKLDRAVKSHGIHSVVLTGGVSANSRLRFLAEQWAQDEGVNLAVPPLRYCTDNAAMIGYVGLKRLQLGESSSLDFGPSPRPYEDDFEY
tara:strand:- start:679 stop:1716 length:1038 start_codon:yes stop_codon:yes gene_type:complete